MSYLNFITKRDSYKSVDLLDREAYIESRNNVLTKSFVTDLWTKVITRAIDDIALYRLMRLTNKPLNAEEKEFESSAISFIFDDNHRIPLSDYLVNVICCSCNKEWEIMMSDLASCGKRIICKLCKKENSRKHIECKIVEEQTIVETSLKEILEIWDITNIKGFREGCNRKINIIIQKRLENN